MVVFGAVASAAVVIATDSGAARSYANTWADMADSACSDIYDSAGDAYRAGNASETMALFDYWHANLLSQTAEALKSIPGAPSAGLEYADGVDYLAQLEKQDGAVSAEGGLSLELTRQIRLVTEDLGARAGALGIPTCDRIVNWRD